MPNGTQVTYPNHTPPKTILTFHNNPIFAKSWPIFSSLNQVVLNPLLNTQCKTTILRIISIFFKNNMESLVDEKI